MRLLAMALLLSWQLPAWAADAASGAQPAPQGPLKPGKSAGVQAAQQTPRAGLALIGAGAIIAIVAVTTTAGSGSNALPNAQSVPVTTP